MVVGLEIVSLIAISVKEGYLTEMQQLPAPLSARDWLPAGKRGHRADRLPHPATKQTVLPLLLRE